MYLFLATITLILVVGVWFVNQPKFGKNPSGERLERIKKSPNYQNGAFKNLSETPQLTSDKPMVVQLYKFLTDKIDNLRPATPIPTVKTDLKNLSKDENILVWLGHSGYFMQIDGKTFLIDPTLLSGSPVSFFNKMFDGANAYLPEDIPTVDYLIITHDHWDHLDYETVQQLKPRIGKVVTGLGVGSHFEHWEFAKENIVELDWNEQTTFGNIKLTALPARHFSGRGIVRDKTLWASFILETPTKTIYIGGDSGYDTFYKEIGKQFPNIDLAILENGQYNTDWAYIHILPEQIPQVVKDLNPKRVLGVHNSKFALAKHDWREPLELLYQNAQKENFRLLTPKIGDIIDLNNENQTFEKWWEEF